MTTQLTSLPGRSRLRGVAGVPAVLAALVAINLTANLAGLPFREWIVPLAVLVLVVVAKARWMRWSDLGLAARHMPRGLAYGLAATVVVAAVVTAGCLDRKSTRLNSSHVST